MGPLKIRAFVPNDHRVEIALPLDVPEGEVELEVSVSAAAGAVPRERPFDWGPALDRLRRLRDDLKGLDLRLSDEVETVDEVVFRQEGDWPLLRARTLEGFGASVDPRRKRLVAVGPHPAA